MSEYKPTKRVVESYEESGYPIRSGGVSPVTQTDALFEVMMEDRRPTQEEFDRFFITESEWQEALRVFHEVRHSLIPVAAGNRDHAESYRGFKVGCVAFGIEPDPKTGGPKYLFYSGKNYKPYPKEQHGKDKLCAERIALAGMQGSAKVIVSLVTVSKEKSTGDPTKAHDVLHPCRDCRDMLRDALKSGFARPDTIMCNVNDEEKELKIEERTLEELLALYEEDFRE